MIIYSKPDRNQSKLTVCTGVTLCKVYVLHKTYLTIAFSQETFSDLVSDKVEDNNSVVKIKDLILSGCSLKLAINDSSAVLNMGV